MDVTLIADILYTNKVKPSAVICLANGDTFYGNGFGKVGTSVVEICFQTSMTGYQETLSDPSYADQAILFTFPYIGNVGTTPEDFESQKCFAKAMICRNDVTEPSNWRAVNHFSRWLRTNDVIGVSNIDTRLLTHYIRHSGMPHAVIAHHPQGEFDIPSLVQQAKEWSGISGKDLASQVSSETAYAFNEKRWTLSSFYQKSADQESKPKVVVIDFGVKKNILRCLVDFGFNVQVVSCHSSFDDIMALKPDGVFLSNGPGDPKATAEYFVPVLKEIIAKNIPIFGICLGHQLLALAFGAKTEKMKFGHHGANHPILNKQTNKVEITSMNHGFTVSHEDFPDHLEETHISLFDQTNCGIKVKNKPFFSVQYHPEASPGPHDSFYLFEAFHKNVISQ